MYGARNQFLPGTCFARNQHRRAGGSDSHDAGKDIFQGGRGAHDLFKHEDLIDLLSQREVLLSCSLLRPFAIVDVGTGRIPADDLSSFVPQRVVLDQEPTILTIPAAHSSFVLEWDRSRDRRIAFVAQSLGILRMKGLTKALRLHFFFRQARVLQYCLIRVQKVSVGPDRDDELRYYIDDGSQFSFGFGYFVVSPRQRHLVALAVVNVGQQHVPSTDTIILVLHGKRSRLEPTVHAVGSTLPKLILIRLSRFDRASPQVDHA